jgi:hypothetical protein
MRECKHHLRLLLWLSTSDRKEGLRQRQRCTRIAVTIWWTTIRCKEIGIGYIHKNVLYNAGLNKPFFLFNISNHHFFLLSCGTIDRHKRLFLFFYSLCSYMWDWLTIYVTSFSFSLLWYTFTRQKRWWILNK